MVCLGVCCVADFSPLSLRAACCVVPLVALLPSRLCRIQLVLPPAFSSRPCPSCSAPNTCAGISHDTFAASYARRRRVMDKVALVVAPPVLFVVYRGAEQTPPGLRCSLLECVLWARRRPYLKAKFTRRRCCCATKCGWAAGWAPRQSGSCHGLPDFV